VTSYCPSAVQAPFHALFPLIFPDDCRIGGQLLQLISRIPLCPDCLRPPEPLVAEYFCISCGTPFQNRFPLDVEGRCTLCRHGIRGFDAAYSFGSYEGRLRRWIQLYKHDRVRTLAKSLIELLVRALPRRGCFEVVAVPLHWRRRWQGRINQSELLARGIARQSNVAVIRALRRLRHTPPQTGRSNSERRKNAAVFAARRFLSSQRILLDDDVLTTGSTGAACAGNLRRAGASRVTLSTVAPANRRLPAILQSVPEESSHAE
jgi:ComF family protein